MNMLKVSKQKVVRWLKTFISIYLGLYLFFSGSVAVVLNQGFDLKGVGLESNIVDKLYWSTKYPNVVDKGLAELLKPKIEKAHASNYSITTGYYVGDNTDNRSITGLGFSPDLLLLKDNTGAGNQGMLIKTKDMSGEDTIGLAETDSVQASNHIQSLDSDGFTIGTDADVNSSNVMYFYAAFTGSDCSAIGQFCTGSYTGNGGSQSITSVGFQPDLVVVKRSGATAGIWKSSSVGGTVSEYFHNSNELASGGIESLDSSGFSVGSNAAANTSGNTYYFVAFKEASDFIDVGTYTGDGTDNREIDSTVDSGLTFRPDFVWIKNASAATAQNAVANFREHYGDRSVLFSDSSSAANHIQSLLSTGGFQVGSSTSVNSSGITYYYVAFGGATVRDAGTGSFEMANGSYVGNGVSQSISGVGFTPDLVIISTGDPQYAVFKTSLMAGDRSDYFAYGSTFFSGGITSIDNDGFSVGASGTVNTSSTTYYWVAFGNAMRSDRTGGSSDFLVGQYIGTGNDNQDVRALPISPDFIAVKRAGSTQAAWRTDDQVGDSTLLFHSQTETANIIQSLNSDGFQKGTSAYANSSGNIYDYFLFKTSSGFITDKYTGNGSSQNITGVGFTPAMLWIKKESGGTARGGVLRISSQTGDGAQPFLNTGEASGAITGLNSNGFDIGSDNQVNENTYTYQYVVWKIPVSTIISISMITDGDIDYGIVPLSASMSTLPSELDDMQTVQNSGNVNESFSIKGQDTSCPWMLSSSSGSDEYVEAFCNDTENNCSTPPTNYTPLTTTYQTLASSVTTGNDIDFQLRLTVPDATTCYDPQSVDVTIHATEL